MAGKVIDLPELREKRWVFEDRIEAGQVLADLMARDKERWPEPILLAIPAGGVPVAAQIALKLSWPLEVAVVSKITPAWNTEFGYGAIAWDGTEIIDQEVVRQLGIDEAALEQDVRRTLERVNRRRQLLTSGRPFPELEGRSVFLVDDGLATGVTMRAAILAVRKRKPGAIAVAVPTGHAAAVARLAEEVDAVYCPNIRSEIPYAVAEAYRSWHDVSEQEARSWLEQVWEAQEKGQG